MTFTPSRLFAPVLASISLVGPLVIHLYMPVIPAAKVALGLSDAQAQLTFSVALFCMAFATLGYGAFSDRYGRRPLLLSGLSLFLFGSVVAFMADSVFTLLLGRSLQAVGAGCGVTLVRTIASDVYGRERLVKAIAYLTMFYTMGPMISPIVGGILIDTLGWRSVFGFALFFGSILWLSVYVAIPETRPPGPVSQAKFLHGYSELLSSVRFLPFVLQGGFNTGTFLVLATGASVFMKELLNRPSAEFGFYFLLFPFGFLFGNFISTRLSGRVANETMVLTGSLMSFATVVVLSGVLLSGHMSPLALFIPGFFITMGQGLSLPFGQAAAMAVNPQLVGMAAGLGVFMQHFGGAVFAQFYGLISSGTPGPLIVTMAVTSVLSVVVAAIPFSLAMRQRKSRDDGDVR